MDGADVLIVGAGLAGAAAAEALVAKGFSVTVLEARDRVGGRGYARSFAGSKDVLDFGGAWIAPWQTHIHDACARHGVALRPRAPVTQHRWFRDGALHTDAPASATEHAQHERCLARIATDSLLLKKGAVTDEAGRTLTDISFAAYLDRIDAPGGTRDFCSAWWTMCGNGDHARVPAAEFLGSCAYRGGAPEGMFEVCAETLVGGVSLLTERMLQAATLAKGAVVERIAHGGDGVTVTTGDGRTWRGKAAVMATGINPLGQIRFEPALPAHQTEGLKIGHIGASVKIWAKVTGVAVGVLVAGGRDGIEWMYSERATDDGATLIVGFGLARNFKPDEPGAVAQAVARFFPEATLLAYDWHDWVGDPYARGTWIAPVLGAERALDPATWRMTGPLAFASSDISTTGAGWFDAAIISGFDAANDVSRYLGRT